MQELSLAVVGLGHPNADASKSDRRFEVRLCHPGDPVSLVPEPRNRADPYAVAVFSERGIQLGYLTAERAPYIRRRLAAEEVSAVFQSFDQHQAVIRVRFGGGAPSLPTPSPAADAAPPASLPSAPPGDDTGFFPDPDGPEWGA